jgi:hypothetical protein
MEGDSAATEEEHRDQRLGRMEAEGPAGDHAQTVVEAFDDAIGEAVADVSKDSVAMLTHSAGETDEGAQPRSRGPGEPLAKRALGSFGLTVIEGLGERLLEQVGTVERTVRSFDLLELLAFAVGEIPGILQQCEAAVLDPRFSTRSVRPRICSRRT